MIRTFMQKRKARRALERLINPKTVESLLSENANVAGIKQGRIEFVVAFVGGPEPAQVSDGISKFTDLAIQHGATVHHIIGALVIVAFGAGPAAPRNSGDRASLVAAVREGLGTHIKLVHGAADGHYGLFGDETRMSYTFLVPQFDQMLGILSRLPLGAVEEVQL